MAEQENKIKINKNTYKKQTNKQKTTEIQKRYYNCDQHQKEELARSNEGCYNKS